jgi:hypothetical protein
MTSISSVGASTASAAITRNPSVASSAAPQQVAQSTSPGPAATVSLSQKALAWIKGDKDWTPGQTIDFS